MFLYHGENDPMITADFAIKSYKTFEEHGLDFTFEKEPGLEHSLSHAEIKKLSKFFQTLMP